MTISELGSLGEFLASIAVLITLIFLVVQMRQNTRAVLRANARQSTEHNDRALSELLDESVADIFLRGQKSLSNLSEVERYRFDLAFTMWVKSVEQAYADYREGNFSADDIIAYENSIPAFLTTPRRGGLVAGTTSLVQSDFSSGSRKIVLATTSGSEHRWSAST